MNKIIHKKCFINFNESFYTYGSNKILKLLVKNFPKFNNYHMLKLLFYYLEQLNEFNNNEFNNNELIEIKEKVYNKNNDMVDCNIEKYSNDSNSFIISHISYILNSEYPFSETEQNNCIYDINYITTVAQVLSKIGIIYDRLWFERNDDKIKKCFEIILEYTCLFNSNYSYILTKNINPYNEIKFRKKPENSNDWFYFIMYLKEDIGLNLFVKIKNKYDINIPNTINFKNNLFEKYKFLNLEDLINTLVDSNHYHWYFIRNYIYDLTNKIKII